MTPTTRARASGAVAAIALATTLAACGASGGEKASTKDASTTTTTEAATTSTTAEATTTTAAQTTTTLSDEGVDTETSELDTLPDGDHYGYMAGHEMGKVEGQDVEVIIWDEVEFLTGDAAVQAAHEDGAIPADQDYVENDYYIRNNNQKVRRLAVVPDASVTTLASDGSTDNVPSSVSEVWKQPHLFKINVGNVRGITTVSSIDAVWLP
ncbi:MAG: hypothetical protein U0P45_12770 [Acidimicrobiales bacterium]